MLKYLPLVLYVVVIYAANLAITIWGVVPIGFGLLAPAGVFAAGLAFTLRDLVDDQLGRRWVVAAIVLGALMSAFLSGPLALASGVAFLVSETADLLVYSPLRERHWLWAVALSNTVGLVVDSVLFLAIAFSSLAFLPGQLVGKIETTVLAVVVLGVWRRLVVSERLRHADVARQPAG